MNIFNDLFVLEMANNHWGNVDRGLEIVREHGAIVRHHGMRAAIKLQFRDSETFVHRNFRGATDNRYIWKTEQTQMDFSEYRLLVDEIKRMGCMPMATPFDEKSVELCQLLGLPIIKVSSADVNDWSLLESIAAQRKPVIVSSGGATDQGLDNVVAFFERREIPLAINHCVSLYPTEDEDLQLDQIDYLSKRYPNHVIGLSTHEYSDWSSSMFISYAKGARTWERHIDIDDGKHPVSSYCSLPHQIDEWFRSYKKAREMCGGANEARRVIPREERKYLDGLVRGLYAKNLVLAGTRLEKSVVEKDFYFAIPLQRGQVSAAEITPNLVITQDLQPDQAVMVDVISGPYGIDPRLRDELMQRGV